MCNITRNSTNTSLYHRRNSKLISSSRAENLFVGYPTCEIRIDIRVLKKLSNHKICMKWNYTPSFRYIFFIVISRTWACMRKLIIIRVAMNTNGTRKRKLRTLYFVFYKFQGAVNGVHPRIIQPAMNSIIADSKYSTSANNSQRFRKWK